jgi:hypothetical protein
MSIFKHPVIAGFIPAIHLPAYPDENGRDKPGHLAQNE